MLETNSKRSYFEQFVESNTVESRRIEVEAAGLPFVLRAPESYGEIEKIRTYCEKFFKQIHVDKHVPKAYAAVCSDEPTVTLYVEAMTHLHVGFADNGELVAEQWDHAKFFDFAKRRPEAFSILKSVVDTFLSPGWTTKDATGLAEKKSDSKATLLNGCDSLPPETFTESTQTN